MNTWILPFDQITNDLIRQVGSKNASLDEILGMRSQQEHLQACRESYTSLFSDRSTKYRLEQGRDHSVVPCSIGVQRMVRSDLGSSDICFTVPSDSDQCYVGYRQLGIG